MTPEKRTEFLSLFSQFVDEYLHADAGRSHLESAQRTTEQGRNNYTEVLEAANHGKDITDLVLLKFIPYYDSAYNRERGAWCHYAPVITKDIYPYMEAAGFQTGNDWPKVAKAILNFVRRAIGNPAELDAACREFSSLPYSKGFQTGTLTPILAAVSPEKFILINSKSRKPLNYFTGTKFDLSLTEYPQHNTSAWKLIHEIGDDMLRIAGETEVPAWVLYDTFTHWLVAEKKYFYKSKTIAEPEGTDLPDDTSFIASLMEEYYPDPDDRRLCADFFANAVEYANSLSTSNWCTTCPGNHNFIRLNVGSIVILDAQHNGINCLVAADQITDDVITELEEYAAIEEIELSSVEGSKLMVDIEASFLAEHASKFQSAMNTLIQRASAGNPRNSRWRNSHLPEIIDWLSTELGRPIPQPSWVTDQSSPEPLQAGIVKEPAGQRYWKIAPGPRASQWDECREEGFIGIGWEKLGDISELTRAEFDTRVAEIFTTDKEYTGQGTGMVWQLRQVQPGDRIVANKGMREVVGIGTVIGGYYFEPGVQHPHRIRVRWDDTVPRPIEKMGWVKTLIPLSKEEFEAIEHIGPDRQPTYTLKQCAADAGLPLERLERWVNAINRKGQAIIYGPPGTGKTFIAGHLAKHLVSEGDGIIQKIQFHPAYSYEEFMQGIRPQLTEKGDLDYRMLRGRFLSFCDMAMHRTGTSVFIIDEINRANLARVFGELMYLLEYRDEEMPLAGGGTFKIPSNVRIIGTMNTADRSIALVDHALRRRFAFLELRPEYDVLVNYHAKQGTGFPADRLVNELKRLNNEIKDPHYEVGISFFMREDLSHSLIDIWQMEIEPYLHEYFFDQPGKAKAFMWDTIHKNIVE